MHGLRASKLTSMMRCTEETWHGSLGCGHIVPDVRSLGLKSLLCAVQGTVKRWETVAAYVRTRTVNEVLDMVKHGLKAGRFAPKQDTFNVVKKRQVGYHISLLNVQSTTFNCSRNIAILLLQSIFEKAIWILFNP